MSYEVWGDGDDQGADPDWEDQATEAGWLNPEMESKAIMDVFLERHRQQHMQIGEGFTAEHDDSVNQDGELAWAGACYAVANGDPNPAAAVIGMPNMAHALWPWALETYKPKDRRTDLVRAAALLIAEIERLDRAAARVQHEEKKP